MTGASLAPGRGLHWAVAGAAAVALASGFALTRGVGALPVLALHGAAGATAGGLSLWRLGRWLRGHRAQAALFPRLAGAVHLALTVIPVGMMASGVGMLVLTGAALLPAGAALPDFGAVPPAVPHGLGARVLIALILLHTAAALLHGWPKRPPGPV